jgi:hypothetical protein
MEIAVLHQNIAQRYGYDRGYSKNKQPQKLIFLLILSETLKQVKWNQRAERKIRQFPATRRTRRRSNKSKFICCDIAAYHKRTFFFTSLWRRENIELENKAREVEKKTNARGKLQEKKIKYCLQHPQVSVFTIFNSFVS